MTTGLEFSSHSGVKAERNRAAAFDSAAQLVILATATLGLLVAWASQIPIAIRAALLSLGLLVWTLAVVFSCIQGVRAAWRPRIGWVGSGFTLLGAAGVGIAALSAGQLGIIRIVEGRTGLVWNVDWRYTWNHAQAISRLGGVDRALDYSGVAVNYHVGPAWLGGAVDRVFGSGMAEVLFGLVPILCVLSAAAALILLLGRWGVLPRLSAAAVGVAFCLPAAFGTLDLPQTLRKLSPGMWLFSPSLMLNSFLALAVGLCSLVLLLDRRQRAVGIIVGTIGLASVVQIKPQFFIGLGAVAGVVGLGRVLGFKPFHPRSWTVLVASVGTLALAVLGVTVQPGAPTSFSAPVWAPGSTGFSLRMAHTTLLIVPLLVAALAVRAWIWRGSASVRERLGQLGEVLVAVVLALACLVTTLALVSFPVRSNLVERANAAGFVYSVTSEQWNLAQSLFPLRLILAVSVLAVLATFMRCHTLIARGMILPAMLVGVLIVASPLPHIANNFARPSAAYEAVEEPGLLSVLERVPRDSALLIASDLADPAEEYRRNLRGFLLTAYGGHEFYVANLRYGHFTQPDAVRRMENLRAFFGSSWSRWHSAWLAQTHVTHVLVSNRCLPLWWEESDTPLEFVGSRGRWSLLAVQGPSADPGAFPPNLGDCETAVRPFPLLVTGGRCASTVALVRGQQMICSYVQNGSPVVSGQK